MKWSVIEFSGNGPCGFTQGKDVYGDGSVWLVSMPGHTPGSVGMFVTTGQGRKLFFVGDTVWLKRAVDEQLAKGVQIEDRPAVRRAISTTPVIKPIRINAPNSVFALGNVFAKS